MKLSLIASTKIVYKYVSRFVYFFPLWNTVLLRLEEAYNLKTNSDADNSPEIVSPNFHVNSLIFLCVYQVVLEISRTLQISFFSNIMSVLKNILRSLFL